jgi:hypothetical protein
MYEPFFPEFSRRHAKTRFGKIWGGNLPGSFLDLVGWFGITNVYSGTGADIVMESSVLIEPWLNPIRFRSIEP